MSAHAPRCGSHAPLPAARSVFSRAETAKLAEGLFSWDHPGRTTINPFFSIDWRGPTGLLLSFRRPPEPQNRSRFRLRVVGLSPFERSLLGGAGKSERGILARGHGEVGVLPGTEKDPKPIPAWWIPPVRSGKTVSGRRVPVGKRRRKPSSNGCEGSGPPERAPAVGRNRRAAILPVAGERRRGRRRTSRRKGLWPP